MTNENKLDFEKIYKGNRVLITGHSGFTGGWLSNWLLKLGAKITGLSLPPNTDPALFDLLYLEERMVSVFGTINERENVASVFRDTQPEIVFHLAAQPIVSVGFEDPVDTFLTNVMGTLHVLEEARTCKATRAVVCITTDKVYANQEWHWGYREVDELGGKDPYSASKACAELVAASYRQTMAELGNNVAIATARGGNIIGGGDWSDKRIIPDFVRSLTDNTPLVLRNPTATRPWQHVLALVHGYLLLGQKLLVVPNEVKGVWNFGPLQSGAQSVQSVVEQLAASWRRPQIEYINSSFPEAHFLHLDSTKARTELGWIPAWEFDDTIEMTAKWYQAYHERLGEIRDITLGQIDSYRESLKAGS